MGNPHPARNVTQEAESLPRHVSGALSGGNTSISPSIDAPGRDQKGHTDQRGIAIVYRRLDDLTVYARNARTHTKTQISKIATSLKRFGWTNPMLIHGDEMIAGHARLSAALAIRDAGERIPNHPDPSLGPTVDLSHLSEDERRAYVIADNKLALDAGWDGDLLRFEFDALRLKGFDLALTGFSAPELTKLAGDAPDAARGLNDNLSYQIVVECSDEMDQGTLIEQFRAQGLNCRPIIL